jgi:hypothetical protein
MNTFPPAPFPRTGVTTVRTLRVLRNKCNVASSGRPSGG